MGYDRQIWLPWIGSLGRHDATSLELLPPRIDAYVLQNLPSTTTSDAPQERTTRMLPCNRACG